MIAIITLLMAILLPALQRVRRQARAVVCHSNLRQWAVVFSMYANDNRGALPRHVTLGPYVWPGELGTYCTDVNDLLLCPMAARCMLRPDNPYPEPPGTAPWLRIVGSKYTAWEYRLTLGDVVRVHFVGSYGINEGAPHIPADYPHSALARNNVPVLLDCIYLEGVPWPFDDPPAYDGQIRGSPRGDMKYFCIDRHNGYINGLFLDWSVRRVGLKELWTLRWSPVSDPEVRARSPWTKAGGVQPEDWPQWMRKFKDY